MNNYPSLLYILQNTHSRAAGGDKIWPRTVIHVWSKPLLSPALESNPLSWLDPPDMKIKLQNLPPPWLPWTRVQRLYAEIWAVSVVQCLKVIPLALYHHAACWKLIVGSCLTPGHNLEIGIDLPDPAREPDSFASTCIMLGINWIDDIEIQSILHQVSSGYQGLQTQTHPTVTTSHYFIVVLSRNGRHKEEQDHFDIPPSYQNRQLQPINRVWTFS